MSAGLLLAAERAIDIGAELLRRGHSHVGALIAKGDRDYATNVDIAIERALKEALAASAPGIRFLGEEEGGADLDADTLWVLDPIDGTINFSHETPLCGISLALVHEGRPVLAFVDLPLLGERFVAQEGAGAFLNGRRIEVNEAPTGRGTSAPACCSCERPAVRSTTSTVPPTHHVQVSRPPRHPVSRIRSRTWFVKPSQRRLRANYPRVDCEGTLLPDVVGSGDLDGGVRLPRAPLSRSSQLRGELRSQSAGAPG